MRCNWIGFMPRRRHQVAKAWRNACGLAGRSVTLALAARTVVARLHRALLEGLVVATGAAATHGQEDAVAGCRLRPTVLCVSAQAGVQARLHRHQALARALAAHLEVAVASLLEQVGAGQAQQPERRMPLSARMRTISLSRSVVAASSMARICSRLRTLSTRCGSRGICGFALETTSPSARAHLM